MLAAFLALGALFALLLVGRYGGGRRQQIMQRWPALVLAAAALFALARGALGPAALLGLMAALAWEAWPRLMASRTRDADSTSPDAADAEARSILGVGADATADQIRAAFRARMSRAHPDRGGSHAEAARLTAARDRLLKRRR